MSTPSPPDEGLSPERLTETLRRSGGLDGGRVVEVAVETSRPTLVSIIQRLRPRYAGAARMLHAHQARHDRQGSPVSQQRAVES